MDDPDLVAVPNGLSGLQAAISATYFPLVLHSIRGAPPVAGAIATATIGPLQWTRTHVSGPFSAHRRIRDHHDEKRSYVLMLLVDGGCVSLEDKRRIEVGPGNLVLLNGSRPLGSEQTSAGTTLAVSFDAPLLTSRFLEVDSWCMNALDASSGSAAILRDCMLAYWRARAEVQPSAANDLASSMIHLLGATFRSSSATPEFDSRCTGAHFMRVRDLVAQHLGHPDLSADFVSDRLRISKSYLFSIMNTAGTTLGRFILERRLERSREMLADPAMRMRSISDIAFSVGFQELSHFSRRFSEQYGKSPRAFRSVAFEATDARRDRPAAATRSTRVA